MVKKMHSRMRRTRRKTRGGRTSYISRRSRPRSASPGRISIINAPPTPEQHQPQQQHPPVHDEDVGPIGHEFFSFNVNCTNGETHTSPYIYSRITARNAAREYCSSRGGVDGRITYNSRHDVQ